MYNKLSSASLKTGQLNPYQPRGLSALVPNMQSIENTQWRTTTPLCVISRCAIVRWLTVIIYLPPRGSDMVGWLVDWLVLTALSAQKGYIVPCEK